jgi:hypothetical protein
VYCLLTDGGTALWLPFGKSIMDSATVGVLALSAYTCAGIAVSIAYWRKTQSSIDYGSLLLSSPFITHEIKVTTPNGWHKKLAPTDELRLVAAYAGLLWPAYLFFCVVFQITKRIAV